MPKAFSFLKIGEANAEIERLTGELNSANEKLSAADANVKTLTEQAEQARKESGDGASIQKQLDAESQAHAATKQKLEKAEADLKAAQAELAGVPEKIKAEASKEAQKITASLGIPPISQTPAANPAAPQKTELKGLAKTQAAFAAQLKPSAAL